jgi:8-hydroxy-5-deazaflavin:NADPH oxidoreductase
MTLGILGGTSLATTLGSKFIGRGMDVMFGVREGFSSRRVEWKILKMHNHNVLSYYNAISNADIILICCENEFLPLVCDCLMKTKSKEKLVIDCTNGQYDPDLGCNTTFIQKTTGHKKIYKAFNNLGLEYPETDPLELVKETYFCGDGIKDKILLKRLIELIGFKAIDAGKLKNACLLEAVYHLRKEISLVKNNKGDYHFRLMSV